MFFFFQKRSHLQCVLEGLIGSGRGRMGTPVHTGQRHQDIKALMMINNDDDVFVE